MKINLKNQLMAWAHTHNLNWLIGFHNCVRGLLKDQFGELERQNDKTLEQKLQKDAFHDYDRILHINTFLMMYSYLEEWLYHYWKIHAPNIHLVKGKGSSIGRFKNVAKQLGVDLSSKHWDELKNAEKIRDCLLHANGRISLFKDPQQVKEIIKKNKSGLEIVGDCVVISGEYLQRFNENISNLLDIMNR